MQYILKQAQQSMWEIYYALDTTLQIRGQNNNQVQLHNLFITQQLESVLKHMNIIIIVVLVPGQWTAIC